jgi:cytochrome c
MELSSPLTDPGGKHDLFFVFRKDDEPNKNIASVNWIRFEGGKEVKLKSLPSPKTATATKTATTASSKTSAETKSKTSPKAIPGASLISKSDCMTCHATNTRLVGPSLVAIAQKYKGKPGAGSMLADKIIKGGSGVWGQIPMVPHPQISKKDASEMVNYILSLRK